MSWWSALDEALLLAFWLIVPGTALLWAMRLRGVTAVLVAPAVSAGGLAAWAVVYGASGVAWNVPSVLFAVAVTVLIVIGVRGLAARLGAGLRVWDAPPRHAAPVGAAAPRAVVRSAEMPRPGSAERLSALYAVVGTVVGGILGAVPVIRGMTRPDLVPQASDTVFHLNAVRYILNVGDASSLHVGRLGAPLQDTAFYPAAWHGIVALGTTDSVVVASNVMVVAVAALIWPAALAAVARAAAPGRRVVALLAPIVGAGFLAFPVQFFSWGALWPNALAYALVPAALACTVKLLDHAIGPERVAWTVATCTAVGGVALAQPNGVLVYAIVTTPFVVSRALRAARGAGRRRPGWAATPPALLAVRRVTAALLPLVGAVVWCTVWWQVLKMMNDQLRTLERTWYLGFWTGAWTALTDAVSHADDAATALTEMTLFPGSRFIGVLAVAGVVALVFRRESRWLIGSLALLLLFAGFADDENLFRLTDAWFSDIFRLRGAVPLASALVIAHALDAVVQALTGVLTPGRRGQELRQVVQAAAALVVVVTVVAGTGTLRAEDRQAVLHNRYVGLAIEGRGALTTPPEQAMIGRLSEALSGDGAILGNPANGSALVSAIADIPVVFPLANGTWSSDAQLVGERFAQIHTDPEVCDALERLGVGYYYADTDVAVMTESARRTFGGLPVDPPLPGFELVEEGGTARVYRITVCQ